jgi:hypothetical protein
MNIKYVVLLILLVFVLFSCTDENNTNLCKNNSCEEWQECNVDIGLCRSKVGFCSHNSECLGENTYCDSNTHLCNAINLCSNINCKDYEECNITTGNCNVKFGFCEKNLDCNENNYCNEITNKCEEKKVFDCSGIDCDSNGECVVFEDGAKCICNERYYSPTFGHCELKPCDGGCNEPFTECINDECQEITCSKHSDCFYEDYYAFCMEDGRCDFAINCGDDGNACNSLHDIDGNNFICDDIDFQDPYGCMPLYNFTTEANSQIIKDIKFNEFNPYPIWIYYPINFISKQVINAKILNNNANNNIDSQFFIIDSDDMMASISYELAPEINYDFDFMPLDSSYIFIFTPQINCQENCEKNILNFNLTLSEGDTCNSNEDCTYQEGRSICDAESCKPNIEFNSSIVNETCNYDENCYSPDNSNQEVLCLRKVNFSQDTSLELGFADYCYAKCDTNNDCNNYENSPYCVSIIPEYSFCMSSCLTDNDCIITNRNGKCERNEILSTENGIEIKTCNFQGE